MLRRLPAASESCDPSEGRSEIREYLEQVAVAETQLSDLRQDTPKVNRVGKFLPLILASNAGRCRDRSQWRRVVMLAAVCLAVARNTPRSILIPADEA